MTWVGVVAASSWGAACGVVTGTTSGSPGAGPAVTFDASAGGFAVIDAGPVCHPSDLLTYVPGSYKPAAIPSSVCLGDDGGPTWDAFYDACLGPNKDTTSCDAYQASPENAACAACIVTPFTDGTLGPILDYGEFVGGNVAGCIELAAPTEIACARAVQAQTDCELAACQANCPVSDPTSLTARDACTMAADMAGCSSFVQAASACRAAEADAGTAAPCAPAAFKDFYDLVVPLFCGQSGEDAGPLDAGSAESDASVSDADTSDAAEPTLASDAGAD
jgi:hypothetical protein